MITGDENNNLIGATPGDGLHEPHPLQLAGRLADHLPAGVCVPSLAGLQEAGAVDGSNAYWYGVDQYLYYTINDCWKAGGRFEWFRDEDGTRSA